MLRATANRQVHEAPNGAEIRHRGHVVNVLLGVWAVIQRKSDRLVKRSRDRAAVSMIELGEDFSNVLSLGQVNAAIGTIPDDLDAQNVGA